ncbi:MAG TPA: hypothetical protein VMZ11_01165 [Mycobacteriales bacterium]|nr:hypothetical protein [Mycobacteriales bacterium]
MYSLLSAAVLAADLARHPHGSRVADALDRVLALAPHEAALVGTPADDATRQRVLAVCGTPSVGSGLADLSRAVEAGAGAALPGLATRLEESLLGTLPDLHALVLREAPVAGLPSYAQQVVCDALTVAWSGPEVALRDLRALAAPWEAALDPVPPALPQRRWTSELRALLDEVPRRTPDQWAASLRRRREQARGTWGDAMHEACAAALDAGRVPEVARAQLAAARALCLTHTGVPKGRAALVLTAAVQACCTADLLPAESARALSAAWEAGAPPR